MRLIRTRWGVWEVETIEAEKGYGPLLYDVALEIAFLDGASGVIPDRSGVSTAAENVWIHYQEHRPDVRTSALPLDYPDRNKHSLRHRPFLDLVYSKVDTPVLRALGDRFTFEPGPALVGAQ